MTKFILHNSIGWEHCRSLMYFWNSSRRIYAGIPLRLGTFVLVFQLERDFLILLRVDISFIQSTKLIMMNFLNPLHCCIQRLQPEEHFPFNQRSSRLVWH